MKKLVIIGMGPGISMGVARKFGKEGFEIIMVSRTAEKLEKIKEQLEQEGIKSSYETADAYNAEEIKSTVEKIEREKGPVDILHYNVSSLRDSPVLTDDANEILREFQLNALNGLEAARAIIPAMKERKSGTIFFTGGGFALFPHPDYTSLSVGKAGLRNLAGSLARAMKDTGIHVATVIVRGTVSETDSHFNPTAIAEQFWHVYNHPEITEFQY